MDTQNKLPVAGETKIAQLFLYDEKSRQTLDCTLYYGNVLEPVINGRVMHLKDEAQYERILSAFFNEEQLDDELIRIEEGGRQYAIPSRWELKRASFEMMNRESAIELEKERQEQTTEADIREDNTAVKEEADISRPSPLASTTVAYTADSETLTKLNEIVEKLSGNEKRVRRTKRLTAVMALITLVALAVSGYLYYLSTVTVPEDITYIKVNGVTYEVPLANVSVEEGEKKILVYGFTVTKKNGEPVYEAVPLGEFDLANKEESQTKE